MATPTSPLASLAFRAKAREHAVVHNMNATLKKFQRIYEIERAESEARVNNYNPLLLLTWGENMDIQFIGDVDMAVSTYCSGYLTKHERGHLQDQYEQIMDSGSLSSKLFKIGHSLLKSREVGLYEVCDQLTGDHLYEKSETIQYVEVGMPHKRIRRIKTYAELQKLDATDPDSEDIFLENLLSGHYPKRPKEMEDVCLHDFVATVNCQTKDAKGKRVYKMLTKRRIVSHKIFDPAKSEQREDYFYSLILLFVPFRDEGTLLRENETAENAFKRLFPEGDGEGDQKCAAHHQRLQAMLKSEANVRKINEARKTLSIEREESMEENHGMQVAGEAKCAVQEMHALQSNQPSDIDISDSMSLDERASMLNSNQRRIFEDFKSVLLHQKLHEEGKCSCGDLKPLRHFVSGVGGTGKSFLIEAMRALTNSLWPVEDLRCAVTAPTGSAAFNVLGATLHRFFQLPMEHEGKEAGYWSLSKAAQKVLRTALRNLKFLVIDEISMVSSLNLTYVHLRLLWRRRLVRRH